MIAICGGFNLIEHIRQNKFIFTNFRFEHDKILHFPVWQQVAYDSMFL